MTYEYAQKNSEENWPLYKLLLNENYRGMNIRLFKRIFEDGVLESSEQFLYGYVCIEDFKELQDCSITWRLRRHISRDINFVGKVGDDGPLDKFDFYIEKSIYDYDYIKNEDDRLEAYYEGSYGFDPSSYELEEEPWYIGIEEVHVYGYKEVDKFKKDLYELADYLLDDYCGEK